MKNRENASPLLSNEITWRDRYPMLESHGYRLRTRYRPDWKPSWLETDLPVELHEDFRPYNVSTFSVRAEILTFLF